MQIKAWKSTGADVALGPASVAELFDYFQFAHFRKMGLP